MPKTIGITGGTGFIGHHLATLLTQSGNSVIIFTRSPKPAKGPIRFATWHPGKEQIDTDALRSIDAMINLAGAGIADKRWTAARKEEIRRSRVEATYFLHRAIRANAPSCTAFVAPSAIGYYGPDRTSHKPFTEADPPYDDFLAQVCRQWEEATFSATEQYRTVTALRTGIVLGRDGGAYPQLAAPMRFGIMPVLGSGEQMVSWIHVDDLARLYMAAALDEDYNGVFNAVAPDPVTHRSLMQTIAKAKGGIKIPAPVPPFVLRMVMGEASSEVLKSCTVSSVRVQSEGFTFQYPTIGQAIAEIEA